MGWPAFFAWVASLVVGELLRPKLQVDNAAPAGLSEFDFPTATEARAVPVVWGTVKLDAPNVVWWGNIIMDPIRKRAGKGGFMGMGRTIWQTVGYRYYAGMHLALCHGPVELLQIYADEQVAWEGLSSGGEIIIDDGDLFGGEDRGGGLGAKANFLPGTLTQAVDPYLQSQLGATLPAWRGVASLVWYGPARTFTGSINFLGIVSHPVEVPSGYLGTSPRIAPLAVVVRRLPSNLGLTTAQTNLAGDANPAEVIYELLTNTDFGLGLPVALVDVPGITAAGVALAAEGMGISAVWDSGRQNLGQFLEEILRTIDAVCFLDYRTGKWSLRLARSGYDVGSLMVLDESSIIALEGYGATALDETVNEVVLTYRDRDSGYQDKQVKAQDLANIRFQDAVVSQAMNYPMITKGDIAAQLAARDLYALSAALTKCDVIANRKARTLGPGDVFKLAWGPLGLSQVVMRVQRSSVGDLHEGSVRLACIQDVFALGSSLYGAPSSTGWVDPVLAPAPCPAQLIQEAAYHLTRSDAPKLWISPQRPNGTCRDFEIWAKRAGELDYSYRGTGLAFCPVGTLTQPYGFTAAVDAGTTLTVGGNADLGVLWPAEDAELRQGANLAVFESGEIVAIQEIIRNLDGTVSFKGVWRGLLDSAPQAHLAGEKLWFVAYGQATTEDDLTAGETLSLKLLPSGARGTLPIGSAPPLALAIGGRALKPYPPGNLKVNGLSIPVTTLDDATATWVHRNRLTQTLVTRQDDPGEAAPEGTITVNVYVGGIFKRVFPGISGTSQAYTALQRVADDADGSKPVELAAHGQNGSLVSVEHRSPPFVMTGFGMTFGTYFGGIQS